MNDIEEIERFHAYGLGSVEEDSDGNFVKYSDYEKLKQERDSLLKAGKEVVEKYFTAEHLDEVSESDCGSKLEQAIKQCEGEDA